MLSCVPFTLPMLTQKGGPWCVFFTTARNSITGIFMDVVNNSAVLGSVQFLTGSLAGRSFNITKPITNLGREPGNDIVISDPSVSRHHAQIMWNGNVWSIKKTAAQNTVTLN